MNLAEGAKRIYIASICIVGLGVGAVLIQEIPTQESVAYSYQSKIQNRIVELEKAAGNKEITPWNVDWADQSSIEFVTSLCSPDAGFYKRDRNAVEICTKYKEEIDGLAWAKTKFGLSVVGGMIGFFIGAALFWMLLAWIGRGFVTDRKSV
jgi:hypothetical protein